MIEKSNKIDIKLTNVKSKGYQHILCKPTVSNKRLVANYWYEVKNNKAKFETLYSVQLTDIAFCNNGHIKVEDLLENTKVNNE